MIFTIRWWERVCVREAEGSAIILTGLLLNILAFIIRIFVNILNYIHIYIQGHNLQNFYYISIGETMTFFVSMLHVLICLRQKNVKTQYR